MPDRERLIALGFIAAGLSSIISVMLFSQAFTNDRLFSVDPAVISPIGLLMVQLWGLAAIAMNRQALRLPWLALVFAAEKLSYVVAWCYWMVSASTSLGAIYEQDWLSGLFFSSYGPFDFLLMCFFLWAFRVALQTSSADTVAD